MDRVEEHKLSKTLKVEYKYQWTQPDNVQEMPGAIKDESKFIKLPTVRLLDAVNTHCLLSMYTLYLNMN